MLGKVSFLVVLLSVLVLCVYAQSPKPARPMCRRGEAFTECGSSCTEPKCKSRNMICPAVCGPGCFCKEGYARNPKGVCVPRFMCAYINYVPQ
uniref:TIL domain-containing protein n=1 Tax=Anopheles minimus TaxID=112268 RepID=A0A182WBB9_9DIPT